MNEIILSSTENPSVKLAKELHDRKVRRERNQFLIEGEKMFFEACFSSAKILEVFVLEGKQRNYTQFLDNLNCPFHLITEKVARHLTMAQTTQPIFAVIQKPVFNKDAIGSRVLVLDNLQDPGNVGTLLRTAAASNFLDVLLINCVDIYNDKVIRATMGGLFKCRTFAVEAEEVEELKNSGYDILCADMHGENIFDFKLSSKKLAVVVGNEGNGISDEMQKLATKTVSIPMANKVESLNAAVSGSLIMYLLTKGK